MSSPFHGKERGVAEKWICTVFSSDGCNYHAWFYFFLKPLQGLEHVFKTVSFFAVGHWTMLALAAQSLLFGVVCSVGALCFFSLKTCVLFNLWVSGLLCTLSSLISKGWCVKKSWRGSKEGKEGRVVFFVIFLFFTCSFLLFFFPPHKTSLCCDNVVTLFLHFG